MTAIEDLDVTATDDESYIILTFLTKILKVHLSKFISLPKNIF